MRGRLIQRNSIFGVVAVAAIFTVCVIRVWAQSAAPTATTDQRPLTFDTASIKLDTSGSGRHSLSMNMPGGRLRAINVSLAGLMTAAFNLQADRIVGVPSWFDTEYFDIEANHGDPPSDPDTGDGNRLRLQALLADRFNLKVHSETRNLPVFALVLANPGKFGPQLQLDTKCDDSNATPNSQFAPSKDMTPSSIHCGNTSTGGSRTTIHFVGHGASIERFLQQLIGPASSPNVDRPIVDRTGLTEPIDFTLDFASPIGALSGADSSTPPSLPTALEEQLGFKLKSDTGPVDVLVIDRVEQPTPN